MKCYVGVGTNLGNRKANLEASAQLLKSEVRLSGLKASPVYQTPALVPPGAPADWQIPFLNAVLEFDTDLNSRDLLRALKKIEVDLGRKAAPRWAPRLIDLDLLLWGDQVVQENDFQLPHPGLSERPFVLRPLKDLSPVLKIPGERRTVLQQARELHQHMPLWMGILNLTPDSFSDGGSIDNDVKFLERVRSFDDAGVQILDLGGESTRPGATPVAADEEWRRLRDKLDLLRTHYDGRIFKPILSVDTRHARIATKALEAGANWINDVGALSDPGMINVLKDQTCDYVLMHSLTVPPSRDAILPLDKDPVKEVMRWAENKISQLEKAGVPIERLIFDPGIGFGKSPHQSLTLLKHANELLKLPVRILIGHSRKSFMGLWSARPAAERDVDGIGVSLQMASRGIDVLRVHEAHLHSRAFNAYSETQP